MIEFANNSINYSSLNYLIGLSKRFPFTLGYLINLLFVFYLYTTVWKDIELGSAYRYIFSFLTILFIDLGNSYSKVIKKS